MRGSIEVLTGRQAEEKITNWVAPNDKTGEFKRGQSQFRNFIKKGGEFPPEAGRYHLYVRLPLHLIHPLLTTALGLLCLPMGAPNTHSPPAERPRRYHPLYERALAHARKGMEVCDTRGQRCPRCECDCGSAWK